MTPSLVYFGAHMELSMLRFSNLTTAKALHGVRHAKGYAYPCPKHAMPFWLWFALPSALSLLCACITHWWYSCLQKSIPGVPYYPPSFLFGNLNLLAKYPGAAADEHCLKLGRVSSLWFFNSQWVVVSRADDVKAILNNSAHRKPIYAAGLQTHVEQALGRKVCHFGML